VPGEPPPGILRSETEPEPGPGPDPEREHKPFSQFTLRGATFAPCKRWLPHGSNPLLANLSSFNAGEPNILGATFGACPAKALPVSYRPCLRLNLSHKCKPQVFEVGYDVVTSSCQPRSYGPLRLPLPSSSSPESEHYFSGDVAARVAKYPVVLDTRYPSTEGFSFLLYDIPCRPGWLLSPIEKTTPPQLWGSS